MVTSADSQIRVLDGVDVICKFRGDKSYPVPYSIFFVQCIHLFCSSYIHAFSGLRSSGTQMFASFTSDGRHIISTSEDSNVYIWNHEKPYVPKSNQGKNIHSCELFFSNNASIAIPWSGMKFSNAESNSSGIFEHNRHCFGDSMEHVESGCRCHLDLLRNSLSLLTVEGFSSLGHAFFSDAVPKGSATWPEEKLPSDAHIAPPSMRKSQYKFLKSSCQNTVGSPQAWGMVIVTAGLDGRIRSFHNYGLPAFSLCLEEEEEEEERSLLRGSDITILQPSYHAPRTYVGDAVAVQCIVCSQFGPMLSYGGEGTFGDGCILVRGGRKRENS
ncbi:hypothetical protein ACLOJK_005016 [Asimina triloba]